jgi:hypothetical protein
MSDQWPSASRAAEPTRAAPAMCESLWACSRSRPWIFDRSAIENMFSTSANVAFERKRSKADRTSPRAPCLTSVEVLSLSIGAGSG